MEFFACCFSFLFYYFLFSVAILSLFVVVILLLDCDLVLAYYCRFGKKPSSVLKGKVVWITGASSGIGEELAYQLAKCGAKLVLSARRKEELERVAEKCAQLSPDDYKSSHVVLTLDLTQYETHAKLVDEVVEQFGKIDILVNNGGRSQRALAVETSLDVHRVVLELNTLGTISLSQAVVKQMQTQKDGLIVVVSSTCGKAGVPTMAGYCASKYALQVFNICNQGYFDSLRMEVKCDNIDVQLVCPGPVVSNILTNALSSQLDKPFRDEEGNRIKRMSTERCVELMVVGMANRLKEVWISPNPFLLFVYLEQYFPVTAKLLGQVLGPKLVKTFKVRNIQKFYAMTAWGAELLKLANPIE